MDLSACPSVSAEHPRLTLRAHIRGRAQWLEEILDAHRGQHRDADVVLDLGLLHRVTLQISVRQYDPTIPVDGARTRPVISNVSAARLSFLVSFMTISDSLRPAAPGPKPLLVAATSQFN